MLPIFQSSGTATPRYTGTIQNSHPYLRIGFYQIFHNRYTTATVGSSALAPNCFLQKSRLLHPVPAIYHSILPLPLYSLLLIFKTLLKTDFITEPLGLSRKRLLKTDFTIMSASIYNHLNF